MVREPGIIWRAIVKNKNVVIPQGFITLKINLYISSQPIIKFNFTELTDYL